MKKILFIICLALLAISCTTTQTTQTGEPGSKQITINNFKFSPQTLKIKTGETVNWKNEDNAPHDITADDNSFTSPTLQKGQGWSHTFNKPGTYTYHCSIHPNMKATVIVE